MTSLCAISNIGTQQVGAPLDQILDLPLWRTVKIGHSYHCDLELGEMTLIIIKMHHNIEEVSMSNGSKVIVTERQTDEQTDRQINRRTENTTFLHLVMLIIL